MQPVKQKLVIVTTLICALTFLLSCDAGLEPLPPASQSKISGRIIYRGMNPPCDSVKLLAVVLVEPLPPYSPIDIISGLYTTVLPFTLKPCSFRDTTFSFTVEPKKYGYLGVAQLYGDSLTRDWRAVGFAHTEDDSARGFNLVGGENITDVDIIVRFDSLIRQPFIQ